ncbi:MAG: hypothetical protein KKG47_14130, partial [Proteobacteria bacterium]|nr:hypothetical protein [Pseudomonadota bacterium]MBU1739851.1 hypothetical protein [Pseudomonadota bacterium]
WQGLQWVYDMQMSLSGDTVQAQSSCVTGPLVLDKPIDVTIRGGFDCDYTDNNGAPTKIQSLTIDGSSGTVTVDNVIIIGSVPPPGGGVPPATGDDI